MRRKGSGAHGPTSPNPYDTEDGPVAYARHITSPVTALVGAAERQQVETGGGSTYRQEQASASKDKRRCNQRQVTSAGRTSGNGTDGAGAGVSKQGQAQVQSETGDKRRQEQAGRGAGVSKQGQAQV